jgi:hypothetical protein
LDKVAWSFQHDFGAEKFPLCVGARETVSLATELLVKYKPSAQAAVAAAAE